MLAGGGVEAFDERTEDRGDALTGDGVTRRSAKKENKNNQINIKSLSTIHCCCFPTVFFLNLKIPPK